MADTETVTLRMYLVNETETEWELREVRPSMGRSGVTYFLPKLRECSVTVYGCVPCKVVAPKRWAKERWLV